MFKRILNIGIDDTLDMYQKKETRFLNLFSLVVFVSVLTCVFNLIFLGRSYPLGLEIFLVIFSFSVPFLNSKKSYDVALYTFVVLSNLVLLYVNLYYKAETAIALYYFPIVFCTALLHNPKKSINRTIILFLITSICLIFLYIFDGKLISKASITDIQNQYLFRYNLFYSTSLTFFVVSLIIRQLNNQHKEHFNLVAQINADKITIETSLEEKEVLLAEVQHRVKNNLSVILGLFNLQLDQSENEDFRNLLNEAKNRVLSIAMVHQKIYKKSDLSKINLSNYISDLVQEIVKSHTLHESVHVYEDLRSIDASVTTAVPVGLIVNEAITNSLKHAFGNNKTNCILNISLELLFDTLILKIRDNGIGFPSQTDNQGRSIGLTLINSLTEQLDAEVSYRNDNGAVVELSIPVI